MEALPTGHFSLIDEKAQNRERARPGTRETGNARDRERARPGTRETGKARNREGAKPRTRKTANG
jgi:hypothetical protein